MPPRRKKVAGGKIEGGVDQGGNGKQAAKGDGLSIDPLSIGGVLVDTTLIHERYGDVTDELLFEGMYKITQLVIGAVPGRAVRASTDDSDLSTIHVFGKVRGDTTNGPTSPSSCARFRCLYEGLNQPEQGTAVVQLNGVITEHLVFRGQYQTVPVRVYGWRLQDLASRYEEQIGNGTEAGGQDEIPDSLLHTGCRLVGQNVLGGGSEMRGTTDTLTEMFLGMEESFASLSGELESVVGRVYRNEFVMAVGTQQETSTSSAITARQHRSLANKGISWILALLAVLHGGSTPSSALVSLGSAGLDLLIVAFQDDQVAKEFVSLGGCTIPCCILTFRGLPGSFYNKAIALACELVRQTGEVGVQGVQEVDGAKKWRALGDHVEFFPVDNFEEADEEGNKKKAKKDGGRKRKSRGANDEGEDELEKDKMGTKSTNNAIEVEEELQNIAEGVYNSRIKDLQESLLGSRTTLAEVIANHYTRFKPETSMTHTNVIPRVLDFYRTVKEVVRELQAMKVCLEGGGKPEGATLRYISRVEEALQVLSGFLAGIKMPTASDDGNSFKDKGDAWDVVLVEVFSQLLCECRVLESFNAVTAVERLVDQPKSVVGALSALHVDFFTTLLEQPGCLACLDVSALRRSADMASPLASPGSNPNFVAYKDYASRISSMLDSNGVLMRLATVDWTQLSSLKLSAKVVPSCLTFHNMLLVGDKLLDKCEATLKGYIDNSRMVNGEVAPIKVSIDINGMETSILVSLTVLQRLLSTTDPRLLSWWIPRSKTFFDLMGNLVGQNSLLKSETSMLAAQKVMGGLFVCSRMCSQMPESTEAKVDNDKDSDGTSYGGLFEVVDVLSSHLPWATIKDNTDGAMDASEYFDVLDAMFIGNTVDVAMSWDDVRLLVDDADILGQIITSASILRSFLENSNEAPMMVQRLGANDLLIRVLTCATEILAASRADNMWMHRVGTSMDVCSMAGNKLMAVELFEIATGCMYYYLQGVAEMMAGSGFHGNSRNRDYRDRRDRRDHRDHRDQVIDSLPMLQVLIKAHAAAALDTQAMMDAGLKTSFIDSSTVFMRSARWNVTRALRFWISCPGLRPRVIPTALVGAVAAPSKSGCTVSFSPAAMLCLSLLLGDVFPSEWPKTGSANILTPEDKKYRAALTEELESCIVPLEYMISCCASSDLSYIRAATVRFLCKGAGLGGGMGTFLMGIISTQFDEAMLPMTLAQVGTYDARKVLEILVPLLYHPALKVAALDTNIPTTIAKLVETIVHQSLTFGAAFDRVESSSLLTMALECLITLADPSITLDVFSLSRQDESSPDVLRHGAGAAICHTILDHIAILGENVPLALNLLEVMSQDRQGRDNILRGVFRVCNKNQAAQGEHTEHPTPDQILTAAGWLVQHYQAIQSNAKDHAPDDVSKRTATYVFGTLETILKRACVGGLHYDVDLPPMDLRTAPVKFATQAKEATSRGSRRSSINFPCNGGYCQLLQDCQELHIFWENQSLRPIAPVSAVTHAAKFSKYVNWDIGSETMDKFCIAGILHPWLTHPTRPLNESMRAQPDRDYVDREEAYMEMSQLDAKQPRLADVSTSSQPRNGDGMKSEEKLEHAEDKDDEDNKEDKPLLDTQVNVDLGALPDLFRQQQPQTQTAQDDEGEDLDDFDLYADLVPAPVAAAPEPAQEPEAVKLEEPIDPNLTVKFEDDSESSGE